MVLGAPALCSATYPACRVPGSARGIRVGHAWCPWLHSPGRPVAAARCVVGGIGSRFLFHSRQAAVIPGAVLAFRLLRLSSFIVWQQGTGLQYIYGFQPCPSAITPGDQPLPRVCHGGLQDPSLGSDSRDAAVLVPRNTRHGTPQFCCCFRVLSTAHPYIVQVRHELKGCFNLGCDPKLKVFQKSLL